MIQFLIVAMALVCAFLKYLNVAAMRGNPLEQALRLLPVPGYLWLSLCVLYLPEFFLWSVFILFVFAGIDKAIQLHDVYAIAKNSIPPTEGELRHRLRYSPYVFAGLLTIYLVTTYHRDGIVLQVTQVKKEAAMTAKPDNTRTVAPSKKETSARQELDSLNRLNP